MDSGALATAGSVIREAIEEGVDLVVINKFGHAEIDNRGLLSEYLAAVSCGIPILTTLHSKYLPDWRSFSGGQGGELPADNDAVLAWINQSGNRSLP